jgi:hypothetical protein
MSDENGQEIGVNVYDDNDEDELIEDEEAAIAPQPVGAVREEIVTVTKNSDTEDNDDLYEVVKAHSDEITRLTEIVESLQSQIKQIDQGQGSSNKTSSIPKNRSTTKTKKSKTTSKKHKGKKSTKRK